MTRPRVVVAGLGDTGTLSAIHLARHADVVGISTQPELVSGQELGMRLARPEAWARDYRVGFDRFRGLDRARIVHGSVTSVDAGARTVTVALADGGERIEPYDVLVVATGVTNGFWRQPAVRGSDAVSADLAESHARVRDADRVAVVGGGAAAVATVAQVASRWPDKQVDLYFPREAALTSHHRNVWSRVARRLTTLGVGLHPGHRAVPTDTALAKGPVSFSTGQPDAEADVVVWAVGDVVPNTAVLPSEWLTETGFVAVGPDLRVRGEDRVFAVGDVAATDPLRTSARNRGHRLLAGNVKAHLAGKPLTSYRPPRRRWGSVLGPLPDGLTVFAPNGRPFRFPGWSVDTVLQPLIVRWGIYRGVRRTLPRRR